MVWVMSRCVGNGSLEVGLGWHQRTAAGTNKNVRMIGGAGFNYPLPSLCTRRSLAPILTELAVAHNMESPSPKRRRSDVSIESLEGQSSPTKPTQVEEVRDSQIEQWLSDEGETFNRADKIDEGAWQKKEDLEYLSWVVTRTYLVIKYCIQNSASLKQKLDGHYATQNVLQENINAYLNLELNQKPFFNHFYSTIGNGRGGAERKWLEFLEHRESLLHSLRLSS